MFSDPINTQQRIDLIEGFCRDSKTKHLIPECINDLCLGYKSKAIEWIIKNEDLDSLLSVNNFKLCHKYLEIESFMFSLSLENKNNHIIFSINPLKIESQCSYRVYCELYCVETQSQFKRTHLFKFRKRISILKHQSNGTIQIRKAGKFESCAWPESLLNISQCENKRKLTFSAHINILDKTQRNSIPISPSNNNKPFRIEYKWDLTRYYNILHDISPQARDTKIYSPNFMDDCWCLWFQKSDKSSDRNQDLYTFGLQLLKLPRNYQQGILFKGRFSFGAKGGDNEDQHVDPIEFTYYVDYRHPEVKIKNIKNVSWVNIEIIMQ
mmetsp:Transcript_69936/g.62708  ORF Transcript_69936/g.62708 Transcript_69936/m.62708 type:complete len:324 (-) Transcript_69936:129-1100(-)